MTPTDTPPDPWPAQWLRGVLDLAVLAVIARGQTYGYRIASDLRDLGLGTVKGGTLYPLLARLEETGAVATTWREGESGPGRKWYEITPTGQDRLLHEGARWRTFAHLTSNLTATPINTPPTNASPISAPNTAPGAGTALTPDPQTLAAGAQQ